MRLTSRYMLTVGLALSVTVALYGLILSRISPGSSLIREQDATQSAESSVAVKTTATIKYAKPQKGNIFPSIITYLSNGSHTLMIPADDFRKGPKVVTGNLLIDNYGNNDMSRIGENGRGVTFVGTEKKLVDTYMQNFRLNAFASDLIPLNRFVPDSRPPGCNHLNYPADLPNASIVIPFHNEWPSVLIRTVYSIINRTPRHLLREIVLVDDASDMPELGKPLDEYVNMMFPKDLVKLIRLTERRGLVHARLVGWKQTTGHVLVIFDSHMEVGVFWLEPLLYEIKRNRKIIALGTLDYINAETFEYKFYENYMTRYGFDWRLVFFETFFRHDLTWNLSEDQAREGVITVGTGFAVESAYFKEIGAYDDGMKTWGGENIELGWRVWMCGGKMIHLPCSHIGHIARPQPYTFPGGRKETEVYNYKRAIDVWMEPVHKQLVYDHFPKMRDVDAGDLSERFQIKERLQCKNFTWFMNTVWPELAVLPVNSLAWGAVSSRDTQFCLDNNGYMFQAEEPLYAKQCDFKLAHQGFAWTRERLLKSSLQCVVAKGSQDELRVVLEDCLISQKDKWLHLKNGILKHEGTGLCLDLDNSANPVLRECNMTTRTQFWTFQHYTI